MSAERVQDRDSAVQELPVLTDTLHLRRGLDLASGGRLDPCRIGFRIHGRLDLPLVLVLGGISADRHVRSFASDGRPGWWEAVVGPGSAIDTTTHAVLCIDYLAGAGESSGPDDEQAAGASFPSVATGDQAAAVVAVLDHLNVDRLHAAVGSSYGGMVVLALAERFGDRVERGVVIGAAHESHPMATALRSIQRGIVRLAMDAGRSREGMRLARALAMTTYRTTEEFAARFSGRPTITPDGVRFPVEEYLAQQGERFAGRFSPRGFLALSESNDLHRVDPSAIRTPITLIAVDSDTLVPPWQMAELARRLPHGTLRTITSLYGHDAFLKEPVIATMVAEAIARPLAEDEADRPGATVRVEDA